GGPAPTPPPRPAGGGGGRGGGGEGGGPPVRAGWDGPARPRGGGRPPVRRPPPPDAAIDDGKHSWRSLPASRSRERAGQHSRQLARPTSLAVIRSCKQYRNAASRERPAGWLETRG